MGVNRRLRDLNYVDVEVYLCSELNPFRKPINPISKTASARFRNLQSSVVPRTILQDLGSHVILKHSVRTFMERVLGAAR